MKFKFGLKHLIAILFIIWAVAEFLDRFLPMIDFLEYLNLTTILVYWSSDALALIGALMMIFLVPKNNLIKTMGMTAIVYGIINLVDAYLSLIYLRQLDVVDIVLFLEGVLSMVVGSILIVCGTMFYLRRMKNSFMLLLSFIIMLAFYLVMSVYSTRSLDFTGLMLTVPNMAILLISVLVLSSRSMRQSKQMYRIAQSMDKMYDAMVNNRGVTIRRSILRKLYPMPQEGLPFVSYEFLLGSNFGNGYRAAMYRDENGAHLTIVSINNTSMMNGYAMRVKDIILDNGDIDTCDTVRFYDDRCTFVQLIVTDADYAKTQGKPLGGSFRFFFSSMKKRSRKVRVPGKARKQKNGV